MTPLAANLQRVRERIVTAAERAGRSADEVTLVAVTKYVDAGIARQLAAGGCHDLGEARPQELLAKAAALADLPLRWHLIGHLQRNKVKKAAQAAALIHSGDRLALLEDLHTIGSDLEREINVLLEVNISGDEAKHGFAPEALEPLLPRLAELTRVRISGLMAMSGVTASPEQARAQFERVRQLRDRLAAVAPANMRLTELSMGMSDDFEEAIAAGATIVRVGSALFEGVGA
jgi:pyridoxal phosphate enzyme (YggS family)